MATSKTALISLRAPVAQRDLIDRAAQAAHKTRTEFMLEASTVAAQNALMDKYEFILDEQNYREFEKMLRAPVSKNEALVDLLATPPPWNR